jgi:chemotaxis regulatin CheY-phosphate phosphatase CheZ
MNEKAKKFNEYCEKSLPVVRELETKLKDFHKEYKEVFENMCKVLSEITELCEKTYADMETETSSLEELLGEIESDESISDEDFESASNAWNKIVSLMDYIDDVEEYCNGISDDLEEINNFDDTFYKVDDYISEESEE